MPVSDPFKFIFNGGNNAAGPGTTIAVTVAQVKAGDTILCWVTGEGILSSDTLTCSDGTSSLTGDPDGINQTPDGSLAGKMFYLLSSVASGSVTYTATFSVSVNAMNIAVQVWRAGLPVVFVDSSSGSSNGDTAITSGNISVNKYASLWFGANAEFGNAPFDKTLSLANAAYAVKTLTGGANRTFLWTRQFNDGPPNLPRVGAATGTQSAADKWCCTVMALGVDTPPPGMLSPLALDTGYSDDFPSELKGKNWF